MVGQIARHCSRSSASREVTISTLEPKAMASSVNISRTAAKFTAATRSPHTRNHSVIERLSSSRTGSRFMSDPSIPLARKLNLAFAGMLRLHP